MMQINNLIPWRRTVSSSWFFAAHRRPARKAVSGMDRARGSETVVHAESVLTSAQPQNGRGVGAGARRIRASRSLSGVAAMMYTDGMVMVVDRAGKSFTGQIEPQQFDLQDDGSHSISSRDQADRLGSRKGGSKSRYYLPP